MKLWAYMCTKMIDNVLDGRAKCNHKAIEKRIKRLVPCLFSYKNVCQNMNYLNDNTRLNAIMHSIFIFQNKNLEFRKI